jgi:hypothetical protein
MPEQQASHYYKLLGLMPSASTQQIRRAYRELSKLYHPDTTTLPPAVAVEKFRQLNEAYATLSSPEQRRAYDLKHGYARVSVIQPPADLNRPVSESRRQRSTAYLDPVDRQLSAGELFALFILGVTFVACLILVFTVGLTRGEIVWQSLNPAYHAASEPAADQPPLVPITSAVSPLKVAPTPPDPDSAS